MRLTQQEINAIKKTFKEDGDNDFYVDTPLSLNTRESLEKKSKFRLKLYELIGEQKIDIVVSKDKDRSIEKEILKSGVLL